MENSTSPVRFHFLPFSIHKGNKALMFTIFFFIYLIGIFVNTTVITVISRNTHLHRPMHLFLAILSLIDITYITVVIPKLLYMLLSGNYTVSFPQCLTQMYFYVVAATSENMVLLVMAYDRYVAICQPLYYTQRLNKKICSLLSAAIWSCACTNGMLITQQVLQLSFHHSVTVHHFFCDLKVLFNAGYGSSNTFYFVFMCLEIFIFGIIPLSYIFKSYIKIISGILLIKNRDGRKKAFSTSSSHLIIMIIYYSSASGACMIPTSERTRILEQVFSMFYTCVIPIINPVIYSLRNNEVRKALQQMAKIKH